MSLVPDWDMELSYCFLINLYPKTRSKSIRIILLITNVNIITINCWPSASLSPMNHQLTYPWELLGPHPLQEPKSGRQGFGLSRHLGFDQIQSPEMRKRDLSRVRLGLKPRTKSRSGRRKGFTYWLILHVGRAGGEKDYSWIRHRMEQCAGRAQNALSPFSILWIFLWIPQTSWLV